MIDEVWTKEKIKTTLDRYIKENGRLPKAPEIDGIPYLPSSRQIQRKFGGPRVLRAELGHEQTDFGKGDSRSELATLNNQRSRVAEIELEKELINIFGELAVHAEKLYGSGKNRADFVVYTSNGNFGIDVFTTETTRDLQKNINIKVEKYLDFPQHFPLYFVVVSVNLSDEDVLNTCRNMSKIDKLPNLKIMTVSQLLGDVSSYIALESPENFIPLETGK